jgi:hypothetical protein
MAQKSSRQQRTENRGFECPKVRLLCMTQWHCIRLRNRNTSVRIPPWRGVFTVQLKKVFVKYIHISIRLKKKLGPMLSFLLFNTQTMHIKSKTHNRIAMFFLRTLYPGEFRTRVYCLWGGWDVHFAPSPGHFHKILDLFTLHCCYLDRTW